MTRPLRPSLVVAASVLGEQLEYVEKALCEDVAWMDSDHAKGAIYIVTKRGKEITVYGMTDEVPCAR